MKCFLILIMSLLCFNTTYSQSECRVKLEAVSQKYIGDCNKGYAHGIGEATGSKDNYKGNFKKGLPHGEGIYTWGNGNTYNGNFVKGKMDGKGTLTIKKENSKEEIKKGFFDKNEYLGVYKYPYAITARREIKNVSFQEDPSKINGALHRITIKVKRNGNYVTPFLIVNDENGSNYSNGVLKNVKYPCNKIEISFKHESYSCRVMLDIYKEGSWIVEISI